MKNFLYHLFLSVIALHLYTTQALAIDFNCTIYEDKIKFCDTNIEEEFDLKDIALKSYVDNVSFFNFRPPYWLKIEIMPNREVLDNFLKETYNDPEFSTKPWVAGMFTAGKILILSPSSWKDDAPMHYPASSKRMKELITHEICHAFHNYQLKKNEISYNFNKMRWFSEGLAFHMAGQAKRHYDKVRKNIEQGINPTQLNNFWSGQFMYVHSASMVDMILNNYEPNILDLLSVGSNQDVLNFLNISESNLIEEWKNYLLNELKDIKERRDRLERFWHRRLSYKISGFNK